MGNVYAVNTGVYSDYRIVAVFSTLELAKEFQQAFSDEDYNDIEEYEVDPPDVNLIRNGYSMWTIHMIMMNGDVEKARKEDATSYIPTNHYVRDRPGLVEYPDTEKPDILISNVWAKTEDQAIKIANEYRLRMIANGDWA